MEINFTLPSLSLYYFCFILNYNADPSDVPSSNRAMGYEERCKLLFQGVWGADPAAYEQFWLI